MALEPVLTQIIRLYDDFGLQVTSHELVLQHEWIRTRRNKTVMFLMGLVVLDLR